MTLVATRDLEWGDTREWTGHGRPCRGELEPYGGLLIWQFSTLLLYLLESSRLGFRRPMVISSAGGWTAIREVRSTCLDCRSTGRAELRKGLAMTTPTISTPSMTGYRLSPHASIQG
jgi:hypothetical protein